MHGEWAWIENYLLLIGAGLLVIFLAWGISGIMEEKRHDRRMKEKELDLRALKLRMKEDD